VSTDDQTGPSVEGLAGRLEFETLIADLSSRFIDLPPGDVDREVEDALRRVCELLGVDHAVLWQWPAGASGRITPTHFHPAQQGPSPSEPVFVDQYPWYLDEMLAGRTVAISSLDELPAEAAIDRESGRRLGIRSSLCLPLAVGAEVPFGALAFNMLRGERLWSETLVKRFQLVTQVLANALARKGHDLRLRESEVRLAAAADLAGLGFYDVDFVRGTIYVDDRLRDVCGIPPDRNTGLQPLEYWLEHLHPDDRQRVLTLRAQLHEGATDRTWVEYRFHHPVRGEVWIDHAGCVAGRDITGRATRTFGVLRDITAQKRAEDGLRNLSRRLIEAHEEERALLARELHDDVTQRLAVMAIEVGQAEFAAPDGRQPQLIRSVREGLVRLSEDVHSLAYQLHPSVLEELGLAEAIRTECERRSRQGLVDVSLDLAPLPAIVGRDVALCLFRITQEALNNIIHHAQAHSARISLRVLDDGLLLAVRDDGVGFDAARGAAEKHLGLASMRERAQLVNGTIDIESAPGLGTAVIVRVPVNPELR
jgi:signal transduction histidine kinase